MGRCYDEALELWLAIGDEAEIANAYYNASFEYSVAADGRGPRAIVDADPDRTRARPTSRARATSTTGSATGAARRTRCGGSATTAISAMHPGYGVEEFRQALEIFREVGDRTMEAWALHMLGTGLLRNGDPVEARGPHRARDPALPRRRRRRRG